MLENIMGIKRRGIGVIPLTALWCVLAWCAWQSPAHAARGHQTAQAEITPSTVYAQAVQIEKEIELLKRYYNITLHNPVAPVEADLQPRHVWQKTYVILIKLSIFRRKHGLSGFSPLVHEPTIKQDPRNSWGQTQRILTEIKIIKAYLGIPGEVSPVAPMQGKRPIDVFNKLNQIAYDMDALNNEAISPSYVYAEVLRINEDVNDLMRKIGTADTAVPPARNPAATPVDSLAQAFVLMETIQKMQRQLGLETTNLDVFRKKDGVVPADVFNMVTLCLGEIQLVKARLDLAHSVTHPAEFHEGKTPAEVTQLLGYVTNKLRLIKLQ